MIEKTREVREMRETGLKVKFMEREEGRNVIEGSLQKCGIWKQS